MKFKKVLFLLAAAFFSLALFSAVSTANAQTIDNLNPSDKDSLYNAVINAKNGDVFDLKGQSFMINAHNSNTEPWIIDKAITFQNGTINCRRSGIILGADVTFNNIEFMFPNTVRNVIAANGYTLTLSSVRTSTSAQQAHLFCGGMIADNNQIGYLTLPSSGTHGKVIINGSNVYLGNIYAGHISTNGKQKVYSIPATISVNVAGSSSIGMSKTDVISGNTYSIEEGIYASGAIETPSPGITFDPDYVQMPPLPIESFPAASTVSGKVTINISGNTVKRINGSTSSSDSNSEVIFSGSENLISSITFKNIGSLNVKSGKLEPSSSSNLENTNINISSGAKLGLIQLAANVFTEVKDFSSNGTVILSKTQQLLIYGNASGNTKVGIGGSAYNTDNSSLAPTENFTYVNATMGSDNATFTLLPYPGSNFILEHDGRGGWAAKAKQPTSELTFTDSDNFNIPASTVGTAIKDIKVSDAVSGGIPPYIYSAQNLPAGININNNTGVISGTPTTASKGGTATITVTDSTSASKSITITYGEITQQSTVPVKHSVTVSASPNTGGRVTSSVTSAQKGDTVSITANANSGWRFTGWKVLSGGVLINNSSSASATFTMPDAAVNIQAVFETASGVLNAPTGVSTYKYDATRIGIKWNAVPGASQYEVWRSTSENGTYTKIITLTGTTLGNSSITFGTRYYYKVRAKSGTAYSPFSSVSSFVLNLSQPANLSTYKYDATRIGVKWNAVPGASQYEVWRSTSENGTYTKIITLTGTTLGNSSITFGTRYYYKVRAKSGTAYSPFSSVSSFVLNLSQPTNLSTYKYDATRIGIKWNAVPGASQYEVWRSTSENGTYTKIITLTGTTLGNSSITFGTRYYYKVRAKNGNTYSPFSYVSSFVLNLSQPTNLSTYKYDATRIGVKWNPVPGASQYEVWRSTSENGTYTKIITLTGTTLGNSSITFGTRYYYKVRAKNGNAYSPFSSVSSFVLKP